MEKWIARDSNGSLWGFEEKPEKIGNYWGTTGTFRPLKDADVPGSKNIRWDDDEPTEYRDDVVHHPSHYNNSYIEVIDVIKMALTPEEFQGFLKGNVLKYELRAQHKNKENPEEDYAKSKFYYDKTLVNDHV